jgi:hypothetical protein
LTITIAGVASRMTKIGNPATSSTTGSSVIAQVMR